MPSQLEQLALVSGLRLEGDHRLNPRPIELKYMAAPEGVLL